MKYVGTMVLQVGLCFLPLSQSPPQSEIAFASPIS